MSATDQPGFEGAEAADKLAADFRELVRNSGGQARVASLLQVSHNTVNKWCRGLAKIPWGAARTLMDHLNAEAVAKHSRAKVPALDDEGGAKNNPAQDLLSSFTRMVGDVGGPERAAVILGTSPDRVKRKLSGDAEISLDTFATLAGFVYAERKRTAEGGDLDPVPFQMMRYDDTPAPGFSLVPVLDIKVSAGPGTLPDPVLQRRRAIVVREDWMHRIGLSPGRAEAVFVSGASMEPTIPDGAMVLVERFVNDFVDGKVYVFVADGEVRVKRIHKRLNGDIVLRSDNAEFGEEVLAPDQASRLVVEGRVRWMWRAA